MGNDPSDFAPASASGDPLFASLLEVRMKLLELAQPSVDYCRANSIDWASIDSSTGGVFLAPIRPIAPRSFAFHPGGRLAAVCEVYDEDGETVIDIAGWSLSDPRRFGTMFGRAPALGMAAAVNPSTYFATPLLRLFRTPLAWLQNGCLGSVLMDRDRGAWWLLDVPTTKFGAEDDEHAADLQDARTELIGAQSFLVPVTPSRPQWQAA